jgi:thiol-disulfide isomerase/thioredoxin
MGQVFAAFSTGEDVAQGEDKVPVFLFLSGGGRNGVIEGHGMEEVPEGRPPDVGQHTVAGRIVGFGIGRLPLFCSVHRYTNRRNCGCSAVLATNLWFSRFGNKPLVQPFRHKQDNCFVVDLYKMTTFYEVAERFLYPYKTVFLILFLVILFSLVAYFVYTRYLANMIKDKKYTDVANNASSQDAVQIYFFSADWCPHCKTAKPEWQQFVKQVNGTTVNNKTIQTIDVDCTDMDSSKTNDPAIVKTIQLVKEFDVKGFPTVLAVKDGKKIDYDAKVSLTTLNKFADAATS